MLLWWAWAWLPLKVNLGWSSEFILWENNTSVACLLESGLIDIFQWWAHLFIVSKSYLRSERDGLESSTFEKSEVSF